MPQAHGVMIDRPGVIPGPEPGDPDMWWTGKEWVALNGNLDRPIETITDAGPYGCGDIDNFSTWQGLPATPDSHVRLSRYLERGPPVSEGPAVGPQLLDAAEWWGDLPDNPKTSETGSGRLFCNRVPGAVAALLLARQGSTPPLASGRKWVSQQWHRGYHFYTLGMWVASEDGTDNPRWFYGHARPDGCFDIKWWRSVNNNDWLPFQGYGSSAGGWSTLYSAKRPPGVTWNSSGAASPDGMHFAVDQSALYAAITGDEVAWADAFCCMETGFAQTRFEDPAGGRQYGHLLRGMASCWMAAESLGKLTETAHYTHELDRLLTMLEARRHTGPVFMLPFLDWGKSDSHVPASDVKWLSDLLGLGQEENKLLAKSATMFMVGIVAQGCLYMLEMVPHLLTKEQRTRLWQSAEVCLQAILYLGAAQAISISAKEPAFPNLIWDDVVPCDQQGLPPAMFGTLLGAGHSQSVAPRFIVPAFCTWLAMAEEPTQHYTDKVRDLLARVNAAWGVWKPKGDKFRGLLETWSPGAEYGW